MTPSMELGIRYDLGDGETSASAEVGGGVEYQVDRFSLSARAQGLLGHSYDEWGASILVRLLSGGASGNGLAFSLEPGIGNSQDNSQGLWDTGLSSVGEGISRSDLSLRLTGEVSYGLLLRPRLGKDFGWEPYAGMSLQSFSHRYHIDSRYHLGEALEFSVEAASQTSTSSDANDQGVQLKGTLRY